MNSATTAQQLTPTLTDCPSWCADDHADADLYLGYLHVGVEEGYRLDVPNETPVDLQFRLRQFTDSECTDPPVIVFNGDAYDEAALRLLATLCMIHADHLRTAQEVEDNG